MAWTTSAPRTASSNSPRPATRTSAKSRARGNISWAERDCTPVPRIASTRASGRASRRVASAAAAAVRIAVMYVPSIERDRRPGRGVEERNGRLMRRAVAVLGKERDELAAEARGGRVADHRAEDAAGVNAPTRGTSDAVPAESSACAAASASRSASRSSSSSTSLRLRTSIVLRKVLLPDDRERPVRTVLRVEREEEDPLPLAEAERSVHERARAPSAGRGGT